MEAKKAERRSLKRDRSSRSHLPSPSSLPTQEMTDSADTDFEDLSPLSESNPPAIYGIGPRPGLISANTTAQSNVQSDHRIIRQAMDLSSLPPRPASEGSSRLQVHRSFGSNAVTDRVISDIPILQASYMPIRDHEDLLRAPKHTIVTLCPERPDSTTAYVVKFDLLLTYQDFIMDAPLDQWFEIHSLETPGPGRLERETNPLLTKLLLLRDVAEWLQQDESVSFRLIQVAGWTYDRPSTMDDLPETWQSNRGDAQVRVQRSRSFKSFDETAAAVFLDGHLHGISSVFGCIIVDSSRIDFDTFETIKAQCMQQKEYGDITVEEARGRLLIH